MSRSRFVLGELLKFDAFGGMLYQPREYEAVIGLSGGEDVVVFLEISSDGYCRILSNTYGVCDTHSHSLKKL